MFRGGSMKKQSLKQESEKQQKYFNKETNRLVKKADGKAPEMLSGNFEMFTGKKTPFFVYDEQEKRLVNLNG